MQEDLPVLVGGLINTPSESFANFAQLDGTFRGTILECSCEINVLRMIGVFLDREGDSLFL